MLAESRLAYKPLTKAELGQILIEFSTVKDAQNLLGGPRLIKKSELSKIYRDKQKQNQLIQQGSLKALAIPRCV